MVGIDPNVSCHHLKIDPKVAPTSIKKKSPQPKKDSIAEYELLSFIDAYSGYNQIPMYLADEEMTSFITDRGLYCYKMISFGLKNVGATYQKLVNKMFMDLIGKTVEVYVEDMLVKSLKADDHVTHLNDTFRTLRSPNLRGKNHPTPCEAEALLSGTHNSCDDQLSLEQVLQKPDASRRLLKWVVELSEFDIVFTTRASIKGQALANFVAEFTNVSEVEEVMEPVEPPTWNLFVDGLAGETGLEVGVVLVSPEGHKLNSAVRFGFKVTNNTAEYEALLVGLRLAKEMQVRRLHINSDSQLVNTHADALSKLVNSKDSELLAVVPIEHLFTPSIESLKVMWVERTPTWMQPIITYLKDQVLPANKDEAYKLRRRSAHFLFIDDVLYKKSFSSQLLQCVGGEETTYILRGIQEGVCGNHSGELASTQKRQPSQELIAVSNPWPFSKWGVDLIGPLSKGRGGANFTIVAIDYFTKRIEAKPLAKITKANTSKFFWKNIIFWFGIFHSIVSDNGRQFNNKKVRNLCEELGIKKHFSTPHHPQANGQVEVVNKSIKHVPNRKLDASKGALVDELPKVLWAIRTTTKTPTG
ncbi:uncharacterized protein LOC111384672 [Olea europaea var. sylvestris]|uniref:uncharacterized protein LOC111384672 n=1 Tax=Olea europaea var. sylvestris TaxID=158386 RepID=UPI000C1D1115|nr:uncharacterized protein LOC111384672 [Olea europaea var. sylvestris]